MTTMTTTNSGPPESYLRKFNEKLAQRMLEEEVDKFLEDL